MPDSSSLTMIVILILLVILSAYFSATETAFTSLNRIRLKSKADAGNRRAALALRLVDQYDNLLSTILVGNNIVNLSASSLATVFFTEGLRLQNGAVISTAVITIVVLVFGEVSPKSLAKEYPESFAMFSAPIMRILMFILTPVNILFSLLKKLLSKVFHKQGDSGITEEELVTMVDQAESEGGLDQHESKLIRSAIEFNDMEVDEILTPRVDIVAVEDTDSMDDIAQAFAESGYSRLPVYHEDIDDIIGVIHEKDFHAARYRGQTDVKAITGPMLYTTGNTKISELLRILQREKAHMVIVVDEYGGTEGLVTLEDIVEELVGEIWDEHDEVKEEILPMGDDIYKIDGTVNIDDVFELYDLYEDDIYDSNTLSGFIIEISEHVPAVNEVIYFKNLEFKILQADGKTIRWVLVSKADISEEEENAAVLQAEAEIQPTDEK